MCAASTPVVLVTGANGYVGAATVLEVVRRGYKVKGAVRTQSKADAFIAKYPEESKAIEWTIVPSITASGAFDAAVQNVDYVIHVASPFFFDFKDNLNDILNPAVKGTGEVLRAASRQPRIKHVVITSSFAAVLDVMKGMWPEKTYTEADWNPATWDEAVASDSGPFVYCASKKFAERAAWDFLEQEHPTFSITTFCPPMVFGPPPQPIGSLSELNTSVADQWAIFSGEVGSEIPPTGFPVFIDVRDLAHLQVAALTNPAAKNQRYVACGGSYSNEQSAEIVRAAFPEQADRIPKPKSDGAAPHYKIDASKAEKDFGIKWTPFEKTVVDTARALYEMEAKLAHN